MADGFEVTDTDRQIARRGVILQFEALTGMKIEDVEEGMKKFVENQIDVKAHDISIQRHLQSVIHKFTLGEQA